MAPTSGFALSALSAAPTIPQNIGKIDVSDIYDNVVNSLKANELMQSGLLRQQATAGSLALSSAQSQAGLAALPSATAANIAQNTAGAAQAPLSTQILSDKAAASAQTTPGQIALTNSVNNENKLQADLGSIFTNAGVQAAPEQAQMIQTAKGNLLKKISGAPGGLSVEPITGPGGTPLGSMIGYMGPNGPELHAMPLPISSMMRQGATNSDPQYIGPGKPNPETGEPMTDQYRVNLLNAFGGIVKSSIIEVPHGSAPPTSDQAAGAPSATPPPAPTPTAGAAAAPAPGPSPDGSAPAPAGPSATPFQNSTLATSTTAIPLPAGINPNSEAAVKYRMETQARLDKQKQDDLTNLAAQAKDIGSGQANLAQLRAHLDVEQQSTLGAGPAGNIPFRPSVAAVQGDIANFMHQTVGNLKGMGRITERELGMAVGNLPKYNDFKSVQDNRFSFLQNLMDIAQSRNDYATRLVLKGFDKPTADRLALTEFPDISGVPAGPAPAGATASPAATAPAAPATPSIDDLLKKYE